MSACRFAAIPLFSLLFGSIPGYADIISVVTVPGTASIWLAGQPDGTLGPGYALGDFAPQNSPIAVDVPEFSTGSYLTFSASGEVRRDPVWPYFGPDGEPGGTYTFLPPYGSNGLSGVISPLMFLTGVFVNSANWYETPPSLDFTAPADRTLASVTPALQQVFFIGDGLTGTGSGDQQVFYIPSGADRLYLAVLDGGNWNNDGFFNVTVNAEITPIPEPSTISLLGIGLFGLAVWRRK